MKLEQVMTKTVVTVNANDPTSTAGRLMWNCGSLPVVGDDGRAVGMITDRDICMSAVLQDRSPSAILVSNATSKTLIGCSARDTLEIAEETSLAQLGGPGPSTPSLGPAGSQSAGLQRRRSASRAATPAALAPHIP